MPTPTAPLLSLLPGLLVATAVAFASLRAAPLLTQISGGMIRLPDLVIALIFGIILYPLARFPRLQPGLDAAVRSLLRAAIALLGFRIAFADIAVLGGGPVLLTLLVMPMTVAIALLLARWLGRESGLGALCGAANAVCGASATLATATVLPDYRAKSADIAFTVVMANALSTVAMLAYPPLCRWLGLSPTETGLMLGLTIQDMAQVVGAAYAVSPETGNSAIIAKLLRVGLLLPMVLLIGWWFTRQGSAIGKARVPPPLFAFAFIGFALMNSVLPGTALGPAYEGLRPLIIESSHGAMLIAIAALGLGTSLGALAALGWRHVLVFLGSALAILALVIAGLFLLRLA